MLRFPAAFAAVLAAGSLFHAPPAVAQPADLAGRWVIEKAVIASWADPKLWADRAEEKRLLGKSIVFGARAVQAPHPLGCTGPTYSIGNSPPEGLFEGGLAENDYTGKAQNAPALARGLGMTSATVPTWETGCSEMLFHRFAPDLILFALDNRIYTVRRKR